MGSKGISLTYVIIENELPDLGEQDAWEERARLAATLDG